jgi:hypothetical protein
VVTVCWCLSVSLDVRQKPAVVSARMDTWQPFAGCARAVPNFSEIEAVAKHTGEQATPDLLKAESPSLNQYRRMADDLFATEAAWLPENLRFEAFPRRGIPHRDC